MSRARGLGPCIWWARFKRAGNSQQLPSVSYRPVHRAVGSWTLFCLSNPTVPGRRLRRLETRSEGVVVSTDLIDFTMREVPHVVLGSIKR